MQSMFKAYVKANKKASKSKKRKNRDNDSSDCSDSEQKTGYGDMGSSVDKRLKLGKPLGTVYLSTEPPSQELKKDLIEIYCIKKCLLDLYPVWFYVF